MRLETERITFGLGGAAPNKTEHIERVRMAPRDNPTDYTIRLTERDGTADLIVLQFTPQNGGELRLKTQPKIIWKRKSEPARGAKEAPKVETSPPAQDGVYREHVTIYLIEMGIRLTHQTPTDCGFRFDPHTRYCDLVSQADTHLD
jgi:hypothetical protein